MISKIGIKDIATYKDMLEINPTEINYFYGGNGSGKTTLSQVIKKNYEYPSCIVEWRDKPLETLVYNREFIKENFSQESSIKGIFTLGKDTKDAKKFIKELKNEIDSKNKIIDGYDKTLIKKNKEKTMIKDEIINDCWKLKQKYSDTFKAVFTGYIGTKIKFLDKCLEQDKNVAELLSDKEIIDKYKKIFNMPLNRYSEFEKLSYSELDCLENNSILTTKIIGKEDVQIGILIKKLNNSDWIKHGLKFLESGNICPFCQQKIDDNLKVEIEGFFDETYAKKCEELYLFRISYEEYVTELINKLKEIIKTKVEIIEFENLKKKLELIEEKLKVNLIKIQSKEQSPSIIIELDSLVADFDEVSFIIKEYIDEIRKNNLLFDNIYNEKEQLCQEVWKFLYSKVENNIVKYKNGKRGIEKAENNIKMSRKQCVDKKSELSKQINAKELEITSVAPTVSEINRILKLFGFNNFRLDEIEEKGFYKIVRQNGEDAKETLSEGEYTFITFLYFYQLIKGSMNKTGTVENKVVVIDDPISSLDSNVLFIVSNLVKEVINDCKSGENSIRQVFVLTHNVYFHKEITFKGNRERNSNKESFWIISKLNNTSTVRKYNNNPIQTTYEILWRELYDSENINTATIFNTLRRILEYYFNILGGIKYEECINKFEGEDKVLCKSLISWINDGSHFIGDDLEMPMDVDKIGKYLKVFKLIFCNMGHEEHYNMMMRKNK